MIVKSSGCWGKNLHQAKVQKMPLYLFTHPIDDRWSAMSAGHLTSTFPFVGCW